ncbi:hypothetical protein AAVH_17484 [Aphelenchoides avenae]|nr:hypothetical protein AAVH_17484 [Aphelenchus avenae]
MDHLFDDELILDYCEEDDFAPAGHARSQTPDAQAKNNREHEALECFALHSEFKVTTGNTVPFADSHLHVDENLRFTLDSWTASDILEKGIYKLSAYVAVFCRPKAYMHNHNLSGRDSMAQASRSGILLQSLCLGPTIGTHPGNAHEWSADVAARITKLVKKGSQDGYRIIGLGEAGLDLTKSAPSRDRKGRRQNPKDPDAIFDHQLPAFREQIQLAKRLRNELGNPLPFVLHLREANTNATTA